MIEGQAGSGKSTTLGGIALAHQAASQELIVTSTAALAAERLAGELETVGARARAYSTSALRTALQTGAMELTPSSTVIHDEAALASTREQHWVMQAVQEAGARLIEVGDPRQSHPVGAGGLWPRIEQTAQTNGSRARLTANVRAQEPADRRDQDLFRQGQTTPALQGYQERDRIHIAEQRRQAEDAALEAAQADREAGRRTLVLSQTSNEHLDELNARAQAIRHQNGELGAKGAALPGRPYQLYPGDEVQIRHTIPHPELGALRNGTNAQVTNIARDGQKLTFRLPNNTQTSLNRDQIDEADIRLAYVQHPFPSQGQTTDTAHLIAGEHANREGSYVALTRARQRTDIYASAEMLAVDDVDDRLLTLAEAISHSEEEVPSIDTPLAHEQAIETEQHLEADEPEHQNTLEPTLDDELGFEL